MRDLASRPTKGRSRRRCVRCRRYWTGRAPRSRCRRPRQNPGSDSGRRPACGCHHGRGGRVHRRCNRMRVRGRHRPRPRRRSRCRATTAQVACAIRRRPIAPARCARRQVRSRCDVDWSSGQLPRIRKDHRRALFGDHRRRGVGVARGDGRHHGGIDHAQARRCRKTAGAHRRQPWDRSPCPSSRCRRDERSWCRYRRRLSPATRRRRRPMGRAEIRSDDSRQARAVSSAAAWCGSRRRRPGGLRRSTDNSARSKAPGRPAPSECARCRARSVANCRR